MNSHICVAHGSLCYIMYNPEDKQTEEIISQLA